MFGIRTPTTKMTNIHGSPNDDERAGPSTAPMQSSTVRRNIVEWEESKSTQKSPNSPQTTTQPVQTKPKVKGPLTIESQPLARRKSTEAPINSQKSKREYADRVTEARACIRKAKTALGESRNLRADIKTDVTQAVERLFQLVKEAETASLTSRTIDNCKDMETMQTEQAVQEENGEGKQVHLTRIIERHAELIQENNLKMEELKKELETGRQIVENRADQELPAKIERSKVELRDKLDAQMDEINQLKAVSNKIEAKIGCLGSYAQVVATPPPPVARNLHSIIVSSSHVGDTSDTIVDKIRSTVDAKSTGIRVDHLRRAKNQSVVISCSEKEDLSKVSAKIRDSRGDLKVEETTNKNPLVVVRDVMSYVTDDDIVMAIESQNGHLLEGVEIREGDIQVKYKRRARNPLTNHVVLRVKPAIWQRLTAAGRIHVDLQRVVVKDQSPLIQCTKCLGYGHSRKYCKEPAILCSHCGDPHTRAECHGYTLGEAPKCRNCSQAKKDAAHNAFDSECPTRKKWEALARSSVAYC